MNYSFLYDLDPFADDDLNAMYLTDKKQGISRNHRDHEELEVLLESFSKQVEEIVNEAENIEVHYYDPVTCSADTLLEEQRTINSRNRGTNFGFQS